MVCSAATNAGPISGGAGAVQQSIFEINVKTWIRSTSPSH